MKRAKKRVDSPPAAAMRATGFISVREAADIGHTAATNIYRWVERGVLEHKRLGVSRVYVSIAGLRKLVGAAMD